MIEDAAYMGWLELNHIFVKLWKSHLIRNEVMNGVSSSINVEGARSCVDGLLLEVIKSELIEPGLGL